jgi:hypothetical protein
MSRRLIFSVTLFLGFAFVFAAAPEKLSYDNYHQPKDVHAFLKAWNSELPQLTKLINIGKSSGKRDLLVFRIAAQGKGGPDPDSRSAVFVSANVEGLHLVGTEAALMLIEKLLTKYGKDKAVTSLLEKRTVTQMRVKDPEGTWIQDPTQPRLMRRADAKKGEKGIYKIYAEGLDNDGDGEYNEDPPGGVEINRNFPHDFEYYVNAAGLWPVSQKESVALVNFFVSHPNIAMVLNFSTENTFLNLQQTGRAQAAGDKFKVPARFASFLGMDPNKEYTMQEIIEILKGSGIFGGGEIDESMVAMMLGLGAAMNIDRQDMPFIQAVQKDYKDALKKAELNYPENRAKGVRKGSFAAYCYYQNGVQVFSSDLWAIPEPKKKPAAEDKDALTVEKLKTMSSEDFLALDEEKIEAFLKKQGAPPNFKASMLKNMVKSGRVTPERMVQMMEKMPKRPATEEGEHPDSYILKWSDTALKGKGFVNWTPFKHPTLGDVEIGGFVPYLKTTPPPSEIEKTIDFHTDFYIKLMDRLAELKIKETKVEPLEDGLYKVTIYLTNPGWFPTSTAQGRRARTSWPIRVELKTTKGQSLFSGRSVVNIPFIGGSGDTKKAEWTIRGKKGSKITIQANSPNLGSVKTTVVLQ